VLQLPFLFDMVFPAPFSTVLLVLKWPALDFGLEDINLSCVIDYTSFYSSLYFITLTPLGLIATAFLTGMIVNKCKEAHAYARSLSSRSSSSLSFRRGPSTRRDQEEEEEEEEGDGLDRHGTGRWSISRHVQRRLSVRTAKKRIEERMERLRAEAVAQFRRLTAIVLLILFATLPLATMWTFKTFACERFDNGDYLLRADYAIDCTTPLHARYEIYAAFMIVIYPIGVPLWFWTILFQRRNMLRHRDPDHYGTSLSKSDGMLHVSGAVGHNKDKLNGWFERLDPERLPNDNTIFQKQGDTEVFFFRTQPNGTEKDIWVIADSDVKNMWHASGSGSTFGGVVDEKKIYWKAIDSQVDIPKHGGNKLEMKGTPARDGSDTDISVKRHFDAMFMSFSFLFEDCERILIVC
jgi:hypothetical protein